MTIPEAGTSLIETARAFIDRLEAIHADPQFQSVWAVNQLHMGPYTGPKYDKELAALKTALEASLPLPAVAFPDDFAETLNFYISDHENGTCRVSRAKLIEVQEALRALAPSARQDTVAVAWRVPVNDGGRIMNIYTEQLPYNPPDDIKVRGEPEPLYTHPDTALEAERLRKERDELWAAIFGSVNFHPSLKNGNFIEMVKTLQAAWKGGVDRAEAAESRIAALTEALDEEIAAYSNPEHDCHANRAVLIALNHVRARAASQGVGE